MKSEKECLTKNNQKLSSYQNICMNKLLTKELNFTE